jgi:hypothetical protein
MNALAAGVVDFRVSRAKPIRRRKNLLSNHNDRD